MFPASSAANYQLHFFLSLLGCFLCPPLCSTLSLQGTALPWSWEGWGQVLRRSLQAPGSCLGGHSRSPCGLHVWLNPWPSMRVNKLTPLHALTLMSASHRICANITLSLSLIILTACPH